MGVWRIRLSSAGEKMARLGLGPTKGNASRLFWADDNQLAVAEGVEDALAFAQLAGMPCWAALSAGNMAELIFPPRFKRITIAADRDQTGEAAAKKLAARLRTEGRVVEIVRPRFGKDANDVLAPRGAVQ